MPAPGASSPTPSPILVAALLLMSGACALAYQLAWLRMLRMVFGHSTAASAAVLAIFMGGLGLGAIWLGRRADRHPNPLRLYARLEVGIALSAAATPWLLDGLRQVYLATGGSAELGMTLATLVRLLISAAVLALPTFLMGGTLSAAARSIEVSGRQRTRSALLYGSNALGAVMGVLLVNFVLLEWLGTRLTLWAAAAVNLLVAALAWQLSRGIVASDRGEIPDAGAAVPARPALLDGLQRYVLLTAAVAGFAFLLMELVWYRTLAPLLGGSTYTFGLILAIALTGMAVGGLGYALGGASERRGLASRLALVTALEGLVCVVPFALGDRIALLALALQSLGAAGFGALVLAWTLIASLLILPMAILSGYQFALLIGLHGARAENVGGEIGRLYGLNTLGAILGSLTGGFLLMPLFGALGAWLIVVVLLAACALAGVGLARVRGEPRRASVAPVAVAGVALALCFTLGPSAVWRQSPIGVGVVSSFGDTPNAVRRHAHTSRRTLRWGADGVESGVAVTDAHGVSLMVNGKSDGNVVVDASTMIAASVIPAVLHEQPKRALVIGLGLGMSAGWLATVPSIEQVDVVELEPAVLRAARDASAVNEDAMRNPKVRIIIGDAREFLLTTPNRYDIIVSEPSNPYRAGVASLFTTEFYQAAQSALNPGGIMAQWLQAYAVGVPTMRTVVATVGGVFDSVESWEIQLGVDMLLIARSADQPHDLTEVGARLAREPYRSGMQHAWGVSGVEGFYTGFLAGPLLSREVAATTPANRLNTDDSTVIEFEFARSVRLGASTALGDFRAAAKQRPELAPLLQNGAVDWIKVNELRSVRALHEGKPFNVDDVRDDPATTARMWARAHYAQRELAAALAMWERQPMAPEQSIDIVMLAEAHAEAGAESCTDWTDQVHAFNAADADVILARCHRVQNRLPEAIDALTRAFHAYRDLPWSHDPVRQRALDLAWELVNAEPAAAAQMLEALSEPFAALVMEDRRRWAHAAIALTHGPPDQCAAALAPLEPWMIWEGPLLTKRVECYERLGSPLLARARRELAEFRAAAPRTFAEEFQRAP